MPKNNEEKKEKLKSTKGLDSTKVESINKVSPSFCLAKWTQVTIDLMHGTNHSCHHPKRHVIPIEEIEKNPAALHNTAFKKGVRKEMLEGKRPSECHYCWNIEDTPGTHYSDRLIKSLDPWSYPYLDKVKESGFEGDYSPHYLEVMFDNACNFACSYCLADISSSVKKEMKEFGPYPIFHKHHRMEDPDWKPKFNPRENPYTDAFWKWLPEIWEKLHVLRVTGGEPLLSKHTFRLLEYAVEHPQEKLTMAINSNLGVEKERLEKLIKNLQTIKNASALESFELYVSVDTHGEQAEYIRQGMDYNLFFHNLQTFLESKVCDRIIIMGTFNILSIPSFGKLYDDVSALKKKYPELILDLSYLKEPEYLRANIIDQKLLGPLKQTLTKMKEDENFSSHEVNKLERIVHWLALKPTDEETSLLRSDFYGFINEYDKRYKKDFLKIFPELKEFYIACKKERFLRATKDSL